MLQSPFGSVVVRHNESLSAVLAEKHTERRAPAPPRRYFSSTLRTVFYLSILLLAFELFVALSRPNFFGVVTALLLLAIFWLNYFDDYYNRFVMAMLVVSSLLDGIWMLLGINDFCNFRMFSHHSDLERPLHLANAIVSIMVNAILKLLLAGMLIPYRDGPRSDKTITCIRVFSTWEVQLTG